MALMNPFPAMILGLEKIGVFLYLFPFLLTLAVTYGVLSYSLEKQLERSARALISIVMGFFVMLFSMWNPGIVVFFANAFGFTLIVGSGLLVIIILLGLIGIKPEDLTKNEKSKWILTGAIILIGVIIFAVSAGSAIFGTNFLESTEILTIAMLLAILGFSAWFITQSK
ncbi:MAG: hypothetical protein NTY20_02170 [Candidatus Aenigmarchaeota archaeon]|nr:hypothetical protein [Candidatus Aenigmarchaeota archaeon]